MDDLQYFRPIDVHQAERIRLSTSLTSWNSGERKMTKKRGMRTNWRGSGNWRNFSKEHSPLLEVSMGLHVNSKKWRIEGEFS